MNASVSDLQRTHGRVYMAEAIRACLTYLLKDAVDAKLDLTAEMIRAATAAIESDMDAMSPAA